MDTVVAREYTHFCSTVVYFTPALDPIAKESYDRLLEALPMIEWIELNLL